MAADLIAIATAAPFYDPRPTEASRCAKLVQRGSVDLRLTHKASRFLGRCRTYVETGAPLKTGDSGEFGDDLEMPMVMFVDLLTDRRSVQHEIIGRVVQDCVHAGKVILQDFGQAGIHRRLIIFER